MWQLIDGLLVELESRGVDGDVPGSGRKPETVVRMVIILTQCQSRVHIRNAMCRTCVKSDAGTFGSVSMKSKGPEDLQCRIIIFSL